MTPLTERVSVPALGALLLAVVVTGCSPGEEPEPSPEPTVATTVVSATPSEVSPSPASSAPLPSPSSTLNEEQTAAVETVLEFFRLKNELSKDLDMEAQPLADVTTGETQALELHYLGLDREDGVVQTGDTTYGVSEVGVVSEEDGVKSVSLKACTNSTATDLIDTTGKSILGPDRAYFVEWNIEVLHEGYRWKVGDITSGRVDLCAT